MTRDAFLKSFRTRLFKPLLIIALLAFAVRFFIHALNAESPEREFVNLISFGFIVGSLLVFAGLLSAYLLKLVVANTPGAMRSLLGRHSRLIGLVSNMILISIIIYFASKSILEKEYENLIGLTAAIGVIIIQRVSRSGD